MIEVPGSFIRYIVVNTKMEPTSEKLVRQAIAAAIDRKEPADIVFMGTMELLYSMVPKGLWSHVDVFKEKYGDANIELAKKLLRQAMTRTTSSSWSYGTRQPTTATPRQT